MTDLFSHPPHKIIPWKNQDFERTGIEVQVLRGDLFHPWIQGNKWYKLRHFAGLIKQKNLKGFLSTGGAWSNHLLALGWYAHEQNLDARFLIRGSEEEWGNHPHIMQLRKFGACLRGISRSDFRNVNNGILHLKELWEESSDFLEVPLGASSAGTVGHVADWAAYIQEQISFSDLVLPVASGGTIAGMLAGLSEKTKVHGIDVLNSNGGLMVTLNQLLATAGLDPKASLCWHNDYHCGGYAGKNRKLEEFQTSLWEEQSIPTEHVYTGKTLMAVSDLANKGHFSAGSRLLVIHTGGLFQWE